MKLDRQPKPQSAKPVSLRPAKENIEMDFQPEPPYPLTLPARRHWDRLAEEIHSQGRWDLISKDLLANFCQTLDVAQACLTAIQADGVLVPGARSERNAVRHPL